MLSEDFGEFFFPPLPANTDHNSNDSLLPQQDHYQEHPQQHSQNAFTTNRILPSQHPSPFTPQLSWSDDILRPRDPHSEDYPLSSHRWAFVDPTQLRFEKSNDFPDLSQGTT